VPGGVSGSPVAAETLHGWFSHVELAVALTAQRYEGMSPIGGQHGLTLEFCTINAWSKSMSFW